MSIALSLFTFAKVVFFAGSNEARIEEHLRFEDARLDRHEAEFARKDVLEMQLAGMRETLHRTEQSIDMQNQVIESMATGITRKERSRSSQQN